MFVELLLTVIVNAEGAADAAGICGRTLYDDGKIVGMLKCIFVDEGIVVDIIDDEVEVAVVVEVGIGAAVGKGGVSETPVPADIGEMIPVDVLKTVSRKANDGQGVDHSQGELCRSSALSVVVCYIVEVGHIARQTVGNDDIAIAVVVKVGNQGAPAPVGFLHAGHKTYLTED